ncbi:MAG: zinc ribbon domain-containing protein [Motiliproteus sp.]
MPTYDYRCNTTGECYEVQHSMSEKLMTWGELCEAAGIEPGAVSLDSPVERLATGGQVVKSGALRNPDLPPCATGGGCQSGSCGFSG